MVLDDATRVQLSRAEFVGGADFGPWPREAPWVTRLPFRFADVTYDLSVRAH